MFNMFSNFKNTDILTNLNFLYMPIKKKREKEREF